MLNSFTYLEKCEDIINDKSQLIHKELFDNAIINYIQDHIELLHLEDGENQTNINYEDKLNKQYIVIDLNDNETYLDSSHAILLSKSFPLTKIKIDLEDYWNKNYINIYKNIINHESLLINENNLKESELDYVDFVKGKVYYKNKFTNKIFGIPFNKYHKQVNFELLKNIKE